MANAVDDKNVRVGVTRRVKRESKRSSPNLFDLEQSLHTINNNSAASRMGLPHTPIVVPAGLDNREAELNNIRCSRRPAIHY